MDIREIMTRGVECIGPDESLFEAAKRMRGLNVGALPVCSGENRLEGIITDRDIVIRGVAGGLEPASTAVHEVMTPHVVWCYEDDEIAAAVRKMEDNQIRRLLVLNRNKRLVGIVSLGDLAVDTGDERLAGEALERISEPAQPVR